MSAVLPMPRVVCLAVLHRPIPMQRTRTRCILDAAAPNHSTTAVPALLQLVDHVPYVNHCHVLQHTHPLSHICLYVYIASSALQRQGRLTTAHVGIVLADDVLHSSSSSSLASPTQPHIIRAHAILTTSVSAREHMPSTHPVGLPRLQTTASLGRVESPVGHGSSGSSSSTASMRRLQRRSTSLLAATSATASNLWSSLSALGDRSRALLCRSSPVLDSGTGSTNGRRSSSIDGGSSRRSSSVDGGSRRSSPVLQGTGPAVTASAVFLPGSVVGSGTSRVSEGPPPCWLQLFLGL